MAKDRLKRSIAVLTALVALMLSTAPARAATPPPTPSASESTPAPSVGGVPGTSPTAASTAETPAATTTDDSGVRSYALKPFMGWSSYSMQVYTDNGKWITAQQIVAQSDAMHAKLQPYGYDRINVDAGWNSGVDDYGRPVPDAQLYPQGLKNVIDHVHRNGQKFGLYFIPGISAEVYEAAKPIYGASGCTTHDIVRQPLQQADYWKIGYRIDFGNPCAQKYIDSIVDLIASWGVDFVKFDSVTPGSGVSDLSLDARDDVAAWSQALARHKIWFELSWAVDINYADYWKKYADGWRVDWDVECYCAGEALTTWDNVARLFPRLGDWWRNAGPGGWNDLDSLNVGNGTMDGLTRDERRTATTLWAISAAPMYIGNDMTKLDSFGLSLLTNREVIAVDQAGIPARPVSLSGKQQVWYALNADGTYTVALFNLGRTESDVTVRWSDIGLDGTASVRDLWAGKNLGRFDTRFVAEDVPIHGVRLLKVTPERKAQVSVNDDSLRMSYDGEWTRNGGTEVAPTDQDLTVSVTEQPGQTPNPPTTGRTVTLNDNDPGIVYTGSWGYSSGRGLGDHNDDVHYAEVDGTSFQYTFQGTGIDYVTETHESQGLADIYLDDAFVKTVDTSLPAGAERGVQQVVYSVTGLPSGSHTLRVVKKSGAFMLLDKLVVTLDSLLSTGSAAFNRAEPADISLRILRDPGELLSIGHAGEDLRTGTDYTVSGDTVTIRQEFLATLPVGDAALTFRFAGDHRGDIHATTQDGASVSFAFTGSGVAWISAKGPDQGEVDVYVDGKMAKRVDTHSASRVSGQKLFSADGLRDGEHTLKLVKVSGDLMRNDVVQYTVTPAERGASAAPPA